jgi:acyl-CoA dehydrogenase
LKQETYHNPNNSGFPNGTLKGTIFVDPYQIIGGPEKAGDGWTMLMECLAVGRGVSLPATANASSKLLTYGIWHYIQHRKQFKMPIGNMEAVREKFIRMFYHTWIINSSVHMTNHILDSGATPSVLTAIMKQQTTERARVVLNDGMDIYAGSAICTGDNNFFTPFYNSAPVGITVEGSNTLTRSLIIFGQGLNKSHPHIFKIYDSITKDDLASFEKHFNRMVFDVIKNYTLSLGLSNVQRLDLLTLRFSTLANFVALLGGKIKSKQMLSGDMADILSNIYLAQSVIWYHKYHMSDSEYSKKIQDYCVNQLCQEAEKKVNQVIENYPLPFFKTFLKPLGYKSTSSNYEEVNRIYDIINGSDGFMTKIKENLYYKNTIIQKLEKLSNMEKNTTEYQKLYQEVISVGEYKIPSQDS